MFDEENELKNADEYRDKMEALVKDCDAGNVGAISCHHAAEFFGMIDKDFAKSTQVFKQNCDRYKYAASCFETGTSYLVGKGVPSDVPTAEEYLSRACDRKHFGGCHLLGKLFYSKAARAKALGAAGVASSSSGSASGPCEGIESDLDRSLSLFNKACKYGYGDSCSFLGMHYLRKDVNGSIHRDPPRAEGYLVKACDKFNNINACYNLAVLYRLGDVGVAKNPEGFAKYARITKEQEKLQGVNLHERKHGGGSGTGGRKAIDSSSILGTGGDGTSKSAGSKGGDYSAW